MGRNKIRLSDAIDEFITAREIQYAKNTIKNDRKTMSRFLSVVGNIDLDDIDGRHVDRMVLECKRTQDAPSINNVVTQLSKFFQFCQQYHGMKTNPAAGRRPLPVKKHERVFLHAGHFGQLLEAADQRHPRDRAVVSLGLYAFLRQSEIATLKVGDVDLEAGRMAVVVHKTNDFDRMVISRELDTELRSWLRQYQDLCGPLDRDWHLVPSRIATPSQRGERGHFISSGRTERLRPHRPISRLHDVVNEALLKIGFPVRDEMGRANGTGCHTLRASGARALFEELRKEGYDGALRTVMSFLHHSSVTMTEKYLGLGIERDIRDRKFEGEYLYPSLAAANVIAHGDDRVTGLRPVSGE